MTTNKIRAAIIACAAPLALAVAVPAAVALSSSSAPNDPPFYHRAPASWCQEDMPCWIGSAEDGRPASVTRAAWLRVLRNERYPSESRSVYVYLDRSDQPSRVFRADVGRVHLRHGACVATVVGYDRWVEVANVNQYPSRCAS